MTCLQYLGKNLKNKPFGFLILYRIFFTILFLITSGCDTVGDFFTEEEEILPGKRESVLADRRQLESKFDFVKIRVYLPKPQKNIDWPQPGGIETHFMPHLLANADLKQIWERDIGSAGGDDEVLLTPPVVAEKKVFTIDVENLVSAFDSSNGKDLWETEIENKEENINLSGGISFYKGKLFVTTGFAQIYSLDSKTGNIIWQNDVSAPIRSSPLIYDDKVIVITIDNQVFAFNYEDGKKIWSQRGLLESTSVLGGATAAAYDEIILVPFSSGEIQALKASTGTILWSDTLFSKGGLDPVSSISDIKAHPVIYNNQAVVVGHGGLMTLLDLYTGARIWAKEIGGIQTPWVTKQFIFVITTDHQMLCLTRDDGILVWAKKLPMYEDPEDAIDQIVWNGPLLVHDRLLITGSNGSILSISPYTGEFLGKIDLDDPINISPIIADGFVYILTDGAELIAFK